MSKPEIRTVRVTRAFNMLLGLPGVNVTGIRAPSERFIVDVWLRHRRRRRPSEALMRSHQPQPAAREVDQHGPTTTAMGPEME